MTALLADDTLDRLFRDGRSYNGFLDKAYRNALEKERKPPANSSSSGPLAR